MSARMMPYAPSQSDADRGRRLRPERAAPRAHADARRLLRRRAASSAATVRIVATSQVPETLPFVQPQNSTEDGARRRDQAQPHGRRLVARRELAARPTGSSVRAHAATKARPLVQCRHVRRPRVVLGPRDADGADGRPREGPRAGRLDRGDDRRRGSSTPRRRASTSRPSAGPTGPPPTTPTEVQSGVTTAIHKFDISSPTKTVYRGSGSVSGYLLSQWSLSEFGGVLRVVSTETPAWWGDGRRVRVVPDDAARAGRRARRRSAGSAGSARASASTRCASSATRATSSRSARSTRSTRSTSPTRRSRACSAS